MKRRLEKAAIESLDSYGYCVIPRDLGQIGWISEFEQKGANGRVTRKAELIALQRENWGSMERYGIYKLVKSE